METKITRFINTGNEVSAVKQKNYYCSKIRISLKAILLLIDIKRCLIMVTVEK